MKKVASIDDYMEGVPEPARGTLEKLRKTILSVAPKGTIETISYGMPAFKYGKHLAMFAAFKNHCSYFPASGRITSVLAQDLMNYKTAKGTIQFALDKPLPASLVKKLIAARLEEIED